MGRSQTIHCIGYGPAIDGKQRIYYAMNRVEIKQEIHKAQKAGEKIVSWYAQTLTGYRILGNYSPVLTEKIPLPRLETCPICEGEGRNGLYFCVVCNGSGICKRGNEKKWQAWQIAWMKEERTKAKGGQHHDTAPGQNTHPAARG